VASDTRQDTAVAPGHTLWCYRRAEALRKIAQFRLTRFPRFLRPVFSKRKAENQLELIAPANSEQVVEFWRALLAMHEVQAKLDQERHRLTVIQG